MTCALQNIFAFPRLHAVSGFERKAFVPYTSEYFKEAHAFLPSLQGPNCTQIINGLVTSILPDKVVLENGKTIPYEYLVLATGTGQRTTIGNESLKVAGEVTDKDAEKRDSNHM